MSTLLATDRVASLEPNLCAAVATGVEDSRAFNSKTVAERVAAWSRHGSWDLIGFTRHLQLEIVCCCWWDGMVGCIEVVQYLLFTFWGFEDSGRFEADMKFNRGQIARLILV